MAAHPEGSIQLDGAISLECGADRLTLFGNGENCLAFASIGSLVRVVRQSSLTSDLIASSTGSLPHRLELTVLLAQHPIATISYRGGKRTIRPTIGRAFGEKIPVPTV